MTHPLDGIDAALRTYLDDERASFEPDALPMFDELERLVAAGGKRVRPLFCYWAHLASGSAPSRSLFRAGAALELLHTFAIVHDDVMDDAATRRGVESAQVRLGQLAPSGADAKAFGVSAAILVGDLALVLADRLFARCGFGLDVLDPALELYDRMRLEAIAGQFLDVSSPRGALTEERARRIAALKTGSYTVHYPVLIGHALAGAPDVCAEQLDTYGNALGEAFQLHDDLIGVFADSADTGKPAGADIEQGKPTVLLAAALENATTSQRERLERLVGAGRLTPDQLADVREIFVKCGALERTQALIDDLASRARAAVAQIPGPGADGLLSMVDEVTEGSV